MKARKMLAFVLALVITLGMMPAVAFAAPADSFHDVDGHWAEEAIDRWSDYGIIEGYEGAFDPNGELTRGQLAAIIARLLNLPEAEANSFTDVDGHWAEDVISRCAEAGIMLGADGKARPDDKVTREETMVMLGRALGIEPASEETISHYPDAHHVSSWAEGYVAALTDKGIVNGIGGELQPGADINRASTVTILHRAIDTYANESGQKVEASGTGIVLVAAENVTVTGEADAVVVAQGAAGGKTTIEDAKVKEVTVTAGETEVVLTGKTEAESVKVAESATAAKVEVTETAKVETVKTEAEKTEVAVSGTVSNVEVAGTATEAKVEVTETAKVETVKTEAEKTEVAVSGTVSKVEVSDTA
ncbi:MAG: S-layer homology domain-containing protein, partial [Firmicutes bacterium]|nr:S-layer homology domain-containing protein [Bacillota bacterium]